MPELWKCVPKRQGITGERIGSLVKRVGITDFQQEVLHGIHEGKVRTD
ncbi:hypothetical protein HSX37_06105|nr:hypothetical protein [Dendrosporobacter quercicolus DSM 1736]